MKQYPKCAGKMMLQLSADSRQTLFFHVAQKYRVILYIGGNPNSWLVCTDVKLSRYVARLVLNIIARAIALLYLR